MARRLGVDFGGTRIKAGLVDGATIVRASECETAAGGGPARVLDDIAGAVRAIEPRPELLGLAIPGEVDAAGRCVRLPNVPGFEGVSIGDALAERLGCAVAVENDATAAALGESVYGHGRRYASFLLVTLGTGIGGGLVIDHRVRRGANGFAGEVGHLLLETMPDAWPCACGLTGCIESYAGTRALLRSAADLGSPAAEVRRIAERALAGEPHSRLVFQRMGRALGRGLASVQNLLDLDAIVFAGGISPSFELIEPSLREGLGERVFAPILARVPLLVSELGEKAGLIGAAELGANPEALRNLEPRTNVVGQS